MSFKIVDTVMSRVRLLGRAPARAVALGVAAGCIPLLCMPDLPARALAGQPLAALLALLAPLVGILVWQSLLERLNGVAAILAGFIMVISVAQATGPLVLWPLQCHWL